MDPRVEELACILVDYSTAVRANDYVVLNVQTPEATPLLEALYRLVLQRGAYPIVRLGFPRQTELYYRHASEEQLRHFPELEWQEIQRVSAYIGVGAELNTRQLTSIDPKRLSLRSKTMEPILAERLRKRWSVTHYPTNAYAQDADMSLAEFEDFFFGATNLDWSLESQRQERVVAAFDGVREVRVVGADTDLTFSLEGRAGIKCDGHYNMPDGEVFYAPTETSAWGHIYYDFPAIVHGKEVLGVRLRFEGGRVVEASAEKNESLLHEMLATDEDARLIGEFGIGVNPGITRFTRDILFDEKIGGTVHLALGRAYEESGGLSRSAIHWDMVKDLRAGGEIHVNGELVQKNGRWAWD